MNVTLKPETQKFIHEQMRAGQFSSPEALIEAALAEFQRAAELPLDDATVAAIHEGLDQADRGEGIDLDTFRARFFKRA